MTKEAPMSGDSPSYKELKERLAKAEAALEALRRGESGTHIDITEGKQAENNLIESERRYRALFENMNSGFVLFEVVQDDKGVPVDLIIIAANKGFEITTGLKTQDVTGKRLTRVLPGIENDPADWIGTYGKVALTGESRQFEQGSELLGYYYSIIAYQAGPKQCAATFLDISDRKRAEEALRESKERYRLLVENSPQGILVIQDDRFRFFNKAARRISGISQEEIRQLPAEVSFESIHPDDRNMVAERYVRRQKGGKLPDSYPIRIIRRDGEIRWADICPAIIPWEGRPATLVMIKDITAHKQAEDALRESKENLGKAQKIAHIGNWSLDLNLNCAKWSDETYRIFGLIPGDPAEISFEFILSHIHPEDRERVTLILKEAAEKKQPFDFEFRTIPIEGSERIIRNRGEVEYDENGAPVRFFGTDQDITERKQAEEEQNRLADQLQKVQKMEAMGLMAGGIAHDLNNILSGIVSYPELLLLDLPEDSPLRKPIKTIQESGMRAADVVEDLLTIARGVASGKEVLNLNTVVEEYLNSAEHQKLEKSHPLSIFKTNYDSESLNITGSASHVKKILMNLIVNASEAIEGKGTVTISTMNRYLDEPLKGYEDVHTGEYVVIAISDDGSGISPQDLERIFEPFYTKKVMGRSGTGLGLAVVWNSMQDHDGYINVKTSEKGTVFELYFPVTREEMAAGKKEVPLGDYLGHGEKILVVDDEERQREIASGILTRLGYTAEAVSSGEAAVEYVKKNSVDLILLDMVMPKGINGRKTYEEIIKIRPGQKAIIASGYAKTKEVDTAQELGAGKYIKKPYVLEKLGVAVKGELQK